VLDPLNGRSNLIRLASGLIRYRCLTGLTLAKKMTYKSALLLWPIQDFPTKLGQKVYMLFINPNSRSFLKFLKNVCRQI
jgi:hypothetical protein